MPARHSSQPGIPSYESPSGRRSSQQEVEGRGGGRVVEPQQLMEVVVGVLFERRCLLRRVCHGNLSTSFVSSVTAGVLRMED